MKRTDSKVKEMTNVALAANAKADEAISIAMQNAEEIKIRFDKNRKEDSLVGKESNMTLKALLTRGGISLEEIKLTE